MCPIGHDDHAREPFRATLGEQPGAGDALAVEAGGEQRLAEPRARRVAEAQFDCHGNLYPAPTQVRESIVAP